MTKTPWIIGAALASALAVTGAHAMPGHGAPKNRADLQAKIAEHFRKADANGDGTVTRAEADAARDAMKAKYTERRAQHREEHFAKLDTDKNGQLSKEEFNAHRQRSEHKDHAAKHGDGGKPMGHHGWHGHHDGMAIGGRWFERADADKDGKLTLAEASAGPLAMFDKVDANKDGAISPEERQAARAAMRARWQEMRGKPGD